MYMSSRIAIFVGCLVIGITLVAGLVYGETVGHDLIDRALLDGAVGSIFVLDAPFAQPDTITSFSIFQNGGRAGNSVTPLLLTPVSPGDTSNWRIVGIGTTYTIADSADRQDFAFGLRAGTGGVDAGIYFGWKDGSWQDGGDGINNNGTIEFDNNTPDNIFWLGPDHSSFAVDDELPIDAGNGTLPRTYSVQASTDLIAAQLEVTIDRDTGAMTLANNTPGINYTMLGYSITSDIGGLDPASWLSIAENYDADNPGPDQVDPDDTWIELTNSAIRTDLSEAELGGTGPQNGALLASGQAIDLGNAWIQNPTEDVTGKVLLDTGETLPALVSFTGNGGNRFAPSDLDFNGIIDANDWAVFKSGQGADFAGLSAAEGYQLGDLDYDGDHDLFDFGLFEVAFDQANGAGALAGLVAAVPEPSTLALVMLAGLACWGRIVRRHATRLCLPLAVIVALALSTVATSAQAGTITVGGEGNSTLGANTGDTAPSVVVIGNQQVVTDTGETYDLAASTFNLTDQAPSVDGTVTPFVALYTGVAGEEHDFTKYDVVAVGDAYTGVGGDLAGVSVAFQAAAGTLATSAGDIVVGGFFDDATGNGVVGWDGGGTPGDVRIIMQGTVDVGTDLTLGATDWSTNDAVNNRTYHYDIALRPTSAGPRQLGLTVNSGTGNITLTNGTDEAVEFDSYQILSPGSDPTFIGSLAAAGWNSIAERTTPIPGFPQGDGSGNGWEAGPNVDANELVEWYLDDEGNESSLASGVSIDLGSAYNTAVDGQDLVFAYRVTNGSGSVVTGSVEYVSSGVLLGDVNLDSVVNGLDVDPFVGALLNGPFQAEADMNLDGVVNGLDVDPFVAAVVGGGVQAVPEPSTLALVALAGLVIVLRISQGRL
jgi:hypothetical protein